MTLFEDIVNETLLTELHSSREDDIKKAINNVLRVRIAYDDGKDKVIGRAKGKRERYILPVAYGLTKTGKRAVRAFQTAGSTKRGVPKWKLFLVDNIYMWSNGKKTFKKYADTLIRLGLNTSGDKGMTTLFAITPIANGNVEIATDSDVVTPEPIAKADVQPTSGTQKPEITISSGTSTDSLNKFKPASTEHPKNIDNSRINTNLVRKQQPLSTTPISKQDVQPQSANTTDNNNIQDVQPSETGNTENLGNEPITKQEVENGTETEKGNDFSRRVNDLVSRMNNLYRDEDENS